jgi:hypothetical protein
VCCISGLAELLLASQEMLCTAVLVIIYSLSCFEKSRRNLFHFFAGPQDAAGSRLEYLLLSKQFINNVRKVL